MYRSALGILRDRQPKIASQPGWWYGGIGGTKVFSPALQDFIQIAGRYSGALRAPSCTRRLRGGISPPQNADFLSRHTKLRKVCLSRKPRHHTPCGGVSE